MKKEISIVWFRQDLRISNNAALNAASEVGDILSIYIFDDCAPDLFKIGSASKIWLSHSLGELNKSLNDMLNLYVGKAAEVFERLSSRYHIKHVFWNTCYEPWHSVQEEDVKDIFNQRSIKWSAFNDNYLWSPYEVLKSDGGYYKVFTAYKNKALCLCPHINKVMPKHLRFIQDADNQTILSDLGLISNHSWCKSIENLWDIGEIAAQKKLNAFIDHHLIGYKEGRDYPSKEQTSGLSAHLHFGEISPIQIWHAVNKIKDQCENDADKEHFLSELIWREFSCYLLYHFKAFHTDNFNNKFDLFGWKHDSYFLKAWQTGHTGYPLIDAGMRQLWQTGYMHNRVRMIVASFLVKNLNIHWHHGRDWFWDCLIDADLASNSCNWQWVAGCGVDAAPYFRIFNPITQGEKFDSDGNYTKKFVPELKSIPNKYLFKPWTAPDNILKTAGIVLGKTYPEPIVDFATSRKNALDRYAIKLNHTDLQRVRIQ